MNSQDNQNADSSKVFSIDTLAYKAQITRLEEENKNLVKQNVGYSQTVDQLLARIEEKDNLIRHLEGMLKNTVPVVGEVTPFLVSDEEYILEMTIKRLKESSQLRPLTKDEVQMLDIAIKNKRLIQGNATTIDGKPKNIDKLSKDEMLQIARKEIKKD